MPELGKYAVTVLSAYGVSLALISGIAIQSILRSRSARRRLAAAEARRRHG